MGQHLSLPIYTELLKVFFAPTLPYTQPNRQRTCKSIDISLYSLYFRSIIPLLLRLLLRFHLFQSVAIDLYLHFPRYPLEPSNCYTYTLKNTREYSYKTKNFIRIKNKENRKRFIATNKITTNPLKLLKDAISESAWMY